ncbi:hypothetical protein HPB51_012556 [Rhipicephalus microplus]|uniref:BED-type domain-containing protein n=1 Tax=Rhipicephalus microplus TaxID=6941 RepID=A0A9J6DGX7_RHIMP|nr:hypothetical protein HPB51_012556 [Rhipicephalus microplus]
MADSEGNYDDSPAKRRNNQDTAPKRRERSAIWKHLVKTSSSLAQCKTCGATLKAPKGTTSPLVNHLKQHPTTMKEYGMTAAGVPEKDQSMIFDFVHRTDPLSEKKTQALNAKVAAMVALDLQPYSFVEDRRFKELMAEAVPNYRLPSRTTLSRTLVPRLFDDTRKKVKDELSSAFEGGTSAVTFTGDMWTSHANESYVSFTCHLLTPSFRMERFTLNTRHMVVSHCAENIAQMLVEMCAEWEIPDGCRRYIVTDNGRNIRAAVRRLPWTERACFAHTLQLAIHVAISNTPSIDRLCKKARHISLSAQKKLDEYQKKMGKDPLRLVQDVDTRWNSQYLMLSRLLDLKEAVSVELAMSSSSIDGLCSAEWKEALEYLDALKPFYDATAITSADKYPSLSTQIQIIFGKLSCLSNFSGTTGFRKELARSPNTRFPLYIEDKEACLAMFLDPRFKSTVFRNNMLEQQQTKVGVAERSGASGCCPMPCCGSRAAIL